MIQHGNEIICSKNPGNKSGIWLRCRRIKNMGSNFQPGCAAVLVQLVNGGGAVAEVEHPDVGVGTRHMPDGCENGYTFAEKERRIIMMQHAVIELTKKTGGGSIIFSVRTPLLGNPNYIIVDGFGYGYPKYIILANVILGEWGGAFSKPGPSCPSQTDFAKDPSILIRNNAKGSIWGTYPIYILATKKMDKHAQWRERKKDERRTETSGLGGEVRGRRGSMRLAEVEKFGVIMRWFWQAKDKLWSKERKKSLKKSVIGHKYIRCFSMRQTTLSVEQNWDKSEEKISLHPRRRRPFRRDTRDRHRIQALTGTPPPGGTWNERMRRLLREEMRPTPTPRGVPRGRGEESGWDYGIGGSNLCQGRHVAFVQQTAGVSEQVNPAGEGPTLVPHLDMCMQTWVGANGWMSEPDRRAVIGVWPCGSRWSAAGGQEVCVELRESGEGLPLVHQRHEDAALGVEIMLEQRLREAPRVPHQHLHNATARYSKSSKKKQIKIEKNKTKGKKCLKNDATRLSLKIKGKKAQSKSRKSKWRKSRAWKILHLHDATRMIKNPKRIDEDKNRGRLSNETPQLPWRKISSDDDSITTDYCLSIEPVDSLGKTCGSTLKKSIYLQLKTQGNSVL